MTYRRIFFLVLFIGAARCVPTVSTKQGCSSQDSEANPSQIRNTFEVTTDSSIPDIKDKVEIKVYYETLCPFSMLFFTSQLKPAVARLGSHLDVHLIPYGHAKTNAVHDTYKFDCQHGQPECFGNLIQACAIDVLNDTTRAVNFNTCLMRSFYRSTDYQYLVSVFYWCGYIEKVNVRKMKKCLNSKRGPILLKEYGDETTALQLSYVPYVLINGSEDYQDQASSDLIGTVCRMLRPQPAACYRNRY
ncbi:gamma-interferon-inducible lysosomal thiol reductase-like [Trichoplusia ni]|uniref:Gamma-interferon-inducible lysosomal thiol reductase-like n=1 Tax=Trichoplusia ni TaxID=7111 RepID=A0A7E5VVE5_TRINI|nr:gamma-interferon-inducible lysosomal thiol reductase-like [Trichoplusia ni]